MDSWDDLRFFLAISRAGTVRGAAEALAVNHATVSRRLLRLEEKLGARLVQRMSDGFRLTEEGERLKTTASLVEQEVLRAASTVQGSGKALSGTVRVATTDLAFHCLQTAWRKLAETHPDLVVEVSLGTQVVGVEPGQADIAVRYSESPPESLMGRRLGRFPVAVYAGVGSGYARPGMDLSQAPWIRWQAPWRQSPLETWVDETYPGNTTVARVDSYTAVSALVTAGVGIAILCPLLAEHDPKLVRLTPDIDVAALSVWLLYHPDLKDVRRVRVVADALTQAMQKRLGQS